MAEALVVDAQAEPEGVASDALDFNVRLRYAIAEGTYLWLVYNEGLDTDRASGGLGGLSPFFLSRSVILKYSHTFSR